MRDIHKAAERLQKLKSDIIRSGQSEGNKLVLLRLDAHGEQNGASTHRRLLMLRYAFRFGEWLGRDYTDTTEEDLRRLVDRIESSRFKPSTKCLCRATLKQFYKWLEGGNKVAPQKAAWIKTYLSVRESRRPRDVLTQEDILKMISAATNVQDKAIVAMLYESGARIGEFLPLATTDLQPTNFGFDAQLCGKTGVRQVPLVDSAPYLATWLSTHPSPADPAAPVWVCSGNMNRNLQISPMALAWRLKKIAVRAGIRKKVNPHSFRHARATYLANFLTEAQMCAYFGWQIGSDMPNLYVHLSGIVARSAVLKLHGLEEAKSGSSNLLAPRVCPRCGHHNEATDKLCERCIVPLDSELAQAVFKQEPSLASSSDQDMLAQLVQRGLRQILSEKGVGLERIQEILSNRREPSPSPG